MDGTRLEKAFGQAGQWYARATRAMATALSAAGLARDLWQGLNAGSRHDHDGDLIDEDPPQDALEPNDWRDRYSSLSWQDVNAHVEALAMAVGITGSYTLAEVVERVQALAKRSATESGEEIRDRLARACEAGKIVYSLKTWAITIQPDEGPEVRIRFEADGSVEGVYVLDEDPPRPEVVWTRDKVPVPGLQPAWAARKAGWWMTITTKRTSAAGLVCGWEWKAMLNGTAGPTYEYANGTTTISEDEAKRRAEEALAVMLERAP